MYTHEQWKRNTQMNINISRIYWIYFQRGFFGDFLNTKDRHNIGFNSFNMKWPNVHMHAHFLTVVSLAFSESKLEAIAWLQYQR